MNIHEYQAKQLFARYGVPVPKGYPAFSADEVRDVSRRLIEETGQGVVVVKAQIHAGGRGKAGGVKVIKGGPDEARAAGAALLGKALVTHQTGPEGQVVRRLYVEQGLAIAKEYYFAFVVDRETRRVAVMASAEGGVNIEEVAAKTPERIHTVLVDPVLGLAPHQARKLAVALGLPEKGKAAVNGFVKLALSLYELFVKEDCSLLEVNPLVVLQDGSVVALDGKINLDENAEYRHAAEWEALRDADEEDPVEREAKQAGLSYVSLSGDIGCLVNGAGLAMATMDIIKAYGGEPANFLDVGGGATQEQVTKAFSMILRSSDVRGIFVNIFGGIMKCDVIAQGVVAATRELGLKVPAVVRLEGTNAELGQKILAESGLALHPVRTMGEGAQKIVALTKG
jgi:succinyl-CoA synthetase beta subunit